LKPATRAEVGKKSRDQGNWVQAAMIPLDIYEPVRIILSHDGNEKV
jgi:hypothetical protein